MLAHEISGGLRDGRDRDVETGRTWPARPRVPLVEAAPHAPRCSHVSVFLVGLYHCVNVVTGDGAAGRRPADVNGATSHVND